MNSFTLSPSKLNLLEDCPRCFWLAMIKKFNRPQGPMSSIPIKMDSIIKKYFEKFRESNELPPIIVGKIKARLAKGMPKTLKTEVDGLILKGLPDDFVELSDGSIVAFDHKTKSKAPEEVHNSYQLQLDVYSFLLKENGYKTKNIAFLAYYFPHDCDLHKGLDIECKIIEVKTNPENVKKLIKKAKTILEGKMPTASKECQYCKFKETKI